MRPEVYWIDRDGAPGRLGTMARPRGGDWLADELAALAADGVDQLVCMLPDSELAELDLAAEPTLARAAGLAFEQFAVEDLTVPAATVTAQLAHDLAQALLRDETVVIHCRAGIGRSSMLAVAVLAAAGWDPEDAWPRLVEARGIPVPDTDEQREYVGSLVRDGWLP